MRFGDASKSDRRLILPKDPIYHLTLFYLAGKCSRALPYLLYAYASFMNRHTLAVIIQLERSILFIFHDWIQNTNGGLLVAVRNQLLPSFKVC